MSIPTKEKEKIIKKYRVHEKDTGSSEVQVAVLTERIKMLTGHLKENPKDNHSRRGLLKMVSKRKSLMDYLKKSSSEQYAETVKKLGLKKNRSLSDKKAETPTEVEDEK
ncbi:MAG: 30S ribosomal protein S15 [Candidatus Pacebacteria bacterium]|nr:30S ribosomal protein S15 [Candidatus Paceibacterota bacterium]